MPSASSDGPYERAGFHPQEGTGSFHSYRLETKEVSVVFDVDQPEKAELTREMLGRVAGKWTLIVIDVLAEGGEMRFTRLREQAGRVSQEMLTQTLRQAVRGVWLWVDKHFEDVLRARQAFELQSTPAPGPSHP
jgi:hypothetical protein